MPVQSCTPAAAAKAALGDLAASAAALRQASGGDLPGCFAGVPYPRDRRGIRRSLASILAMCAAAALCGCSSLEDVTAWVSSAVHEILAALGCRRNALGVFTPPHPVLAHGLHATERFLERLAEYASHGDISSAARFTGIAEKTAERWYYDYLERLRKEPAKDLLPIRSLGIDELSLKKDTGSSAAY